MKTDLFSKKEARNYKTIPGAEDQTSDEKEAKTGSCGCGPDGSESIAAGDGSAASTSYSNTPAANSGAERGPKGAKSVPVGDGTAASTSYNSNKN